VFRSARNSGHVVKLSKYTNQLRLALSLSSCFCRYRKTVFGFRTVTAITISIHALQRRSWAIALALSCSLQVIAASSWRTAKAKLACTTMPVIDKSGHLPMLEVAKFTLQVISASSWRTAMAKLAFTTLQVIGKSGHSPIWRWRTFFFCNKSSQPAVGGPRWQTCLAQREEELAKVDNHEGGFWWELLPGVPTLGRWGRPVLFRAQWYHRGAVPGSGDSVGKSCGRKGEPYDAAKGRCSL